MRSFGHAPEIWRDFPELAAGCLAATGITGGADVREPVARFCAVADGRLATGPESELPEIRAWRRAFSRMGLKPTQYRCAAESLARRYRRERSLPSLHPLVDLCNAVSLAFAVPIAVLDADRVEWPLRVRYATGDERYLTFGGEEEKPYAGEVVFADAAGHAHARRWTHRQSALSAVRPETTSVLVVAEAMHETARADIARLVDALSAELAATWRPPPATGVLTPDAPEFTVAA
ncbi:MAG TPA: phenylalanine--tRNA ligase beta subunit-related protein [Streptosporangiales bacterium]